MINLEEIVVDSDLSEAYTIQRTIGSAFVLGGFSTTTTIVPGYGPVTVASDQDLQMVPEGDRVTGMMSFHSATRIYITEFDPVNNKQHVSDIIIWHNQQYRVLHSAPWGDFGYWRAIAARMAGN